MVVNNRANRFYSYSAMQTDIVFPVTEVLKVYERLAIKKNMFGVLPQGHHQSQARDN